MWLNMRVSIGSSLRKGSGDTDTTAQAFTLQRDNTLKMLNRTADALYSMPDRYFFGKSMLPDLGTSDMRTVRGLLE